MTVDIGAPFTHVPRQALLEGVAALRGDDFLLLADAQGLDDVAAAVLDASWSAGGLPVTLSLASVLCEPGSVTDHREAAACLVPLKKAAKELPGASWVLGRPGTPVYEVLRGGSSHSAPPMTLTVHHQR